MKNRALWFLIGGLLVLIYFGVSKSNESAVGSGKTVNVESSKSLELIEKQVRLSKAASSIASTPASSSASTAQKMNEPEKSCWEKIRDQYQANTEYLAESRHRLSDLVGPWYYQSGDARSGGNIEESSPQGKFFLALAKAGLLDGAKLETDEEVALLLLDQVAAVDPRNSAPLLYAAIIEHRRGNFASAKTLLSEANQSKYFDSYLKDFRFALFDGVKSPSDLLAAQEAWSTALAPNYKALREIVEVFKQANLAHQLIQDGLRGDRERVEDLGWIPIEYAIGKNLLDSFGAGTHFPEYRDLLQKNPSVLEEVAQRAVSKLDSTCDLESLESEVRTIRDHLDRARNKAL